MKRLLLAAVALAALSLPAQATVVGNLGVNPTSQFGDFSSGTLGVNGTGSGLFTDDFLFQLVGGPQFLTIASVTNVFPGGPLTTDFITNFSASVFSYGPDNLFGGGDDQIVLGPANATMGCGIIVNCQGMAGIALLDAGSYYLELSGTGGGSSGYGGNIATFAEAETPLPAAVWLFGSAVGGGALLLRRRKKQAALAA